MRQQKMSVAKAADIAAKATAAGASAVFSPFIPAPSHAAEIFAVPVPTAPPLSVQQLQELIRLQTLLQQQQKQGHQPQPHLTHPLLQPGLYPATSALAAPTSYISLETATSDASAAAVAYYSDVEFAVQLCQEFIAEEVPNNPVAVALKDACDVFRRILSLQQQPTAKSQLLTALNAAGPRADPSLTSRASALLNRQPTWPLHEALIRFNVPLFRQKRSWLGSKQWYQRFYVLRGRRLYHSNGKNGFPDSRIGTFAYVQSKPVPDQHCCINLSGARAVLCIPHSFFPPPSHDDAQAAA